MLLPVLQVTHVTHVAFWVLFDDLSPHLGLPIHEDELEPFKDCLDLDRTTDASLLQIVTQN